MIFAWPLGAKFSDGLLEVDQHETRLAQSQGCPHCGARLDRADFPRKPRGIPGFWEPAFRRRFSLCCSREGCRKRVTPPSVRFLGRRVYAAAVVMLACLRPWVAASAAVPRRTVGRWLTWWRTAFGNTGFWRTTQSRFVPPVDQAELPASLIERFWRSGAPSRTEQALLKALVFVSPITTSSSFSRDGP